ncbi:hypothetical protein GCM10028783_41070 [Modestobacter muralis]
MVELAHDGDLLLQDMALPDREVPHGQLRATPSEVARTAAEARFGALVLTRVRPELEKGREAAEQLIRQQYEGTSCGRRTCSPSAQGCEH